MKRKLSLKEKESLNAEMFEYIRAKATFYLEAGPEKYRDGDAFRQPAADLPVEDLDKLQEGCNQIVHNQGLTPETPLEGLGIKGFYLLMKMFHFRVVKQIIKSMESELITDQMVMKHRVTGQKIILFNKVKKSCGLC